jgi:hypothetical protein
MMSAKIPFQERKTRLRGVLDILGGSYPGFLFRQPVRDLLPVFHFHDVTQAYLEPYLAYLADNGYRTVTSDALGRFVRDGVRPGPRTVVLCFDDAWGSLWTVVAPLLRKYGLTAITYAIAGRVPDAEGPRPLEAAEGTNVLASWPELKALNDEGVVDVQAHTYSHAMIFCDPQPAGFLSPDSRISYLSMPAINFTPAPVFLDASMLGAPLYPRRSRMSDAFRYVDDAGARQACIDLVHAGGGGTSFFENPAKQAELFRIVSKARGRVESAEEREAAIWQELVRSKAVLADKLKSQSVRQICFPWGVCGRLAGELVKKAGYETAVADTLFGKRCAVPQGNPYRIMRLKHPYIACLPGAGRKTFFNATC